MDQNGILFFVQIINPVVQIISLVFLIIYVIKTWEMASATRRAAEATEKSVAEMRETRDQETAPYVVTYFEIPTGSSLIYLVVKNIGRSVATRVHLEFDPPLRTSDNAYLEHLSFIRNGIESMPPDYEIRTLIDSAVSYFGNSELPLKYTVRVSYFGGIHSSERLYEQVLDLSAQKGLMYVRRKTMNDLAEEVEKLVREVREIREAADSISTTLSKGTFINNPSLTIATISPKMPEWAEAFSAKAREFESLWLTSYKDERLKGFDSARLQTHMLHLSDQFHLLLSNRPVDIPDDVVGSALAAFARLHGLGRMRFYADGGASIKSFNDSGDEILEQIKNVAELIKKAAQPRAAADVPTAPASTEAQAVQPSSQTSG